MSEDQALSCFLASLKHEIEMVVRMFNPRALQAVYSLATLQDALKNDSTTMSRKELVSKFNEEQLADSALNPSATTINSSNGPPYKENSSSTTTKRPLNLTPKLLEEKRLKN